MHNIVFTDIQNIGGISQDSHGEPPTMATNKFAANMPNV